MDEARLLVRLSDFSIFQCFDAVGSLTGRHPARNQIISVVLSHRSVLEQ